MSDFAGVVLVFGIAAVAAIGFALIRHGLSR